MALIKGYRHAGQRSRKKSARELFGNPAVDIARAETPHGPELKATHDSLARITLESFRVYGHCTAHDCPQKVRLISLPKENAMPLLEVTQTRHVSASIRLTDSTALLVDQYAAFIKAPANSVVEEALKHVFAKDRDFQEYLKSPEAQRITPTLRVRRASANDGMAASAKKPVSAASSASQTPAVVAGSRA
jgi:hypothetical protein